MSRESKPTLRVCSITDALAIVGDRYALLVARELRYGQTRFQTSPPAPGSRDVLTARCASSSRPAVYVFGAWPSI